MTNHYSTTKNAQGVEGGGGSPLGKKGFKTRRRRRPKWRGGFLLAFGGAENFPRRKGKDKMEGVYGGKLGKTEKKRSGRKLPL